MTFERADGAGSTAPASAGDGAMSDGGPPPAKKKNGPAQWALFVLRWGIAVVGVWLVVSHMSFRDQAWVILDKSTMRPQQVSLSRAVGEEASEYPVVGQAHPVPRAQVVNEPDAKSVTLKNGKTVSLLGVDLPADLRPAPSRLLVADTATGPARWVPAGEAPSYKVKVPHPRDQTGLDSMVRNARPALLWAAVLVFPLTFIITSYRWNLLLSLLEIRMSQGRTFVLNMVGCFYNTFMPGSTGGDMLKAWYASKQTTNRTRAVMSVLVDRVIGLLALILIGGATAALQWHIPACRKVSLAAAGIWACVVLGLAVFFNPTLHRLSGLDWILSKLPMQKQVRGAIDAMHRYGKRPMSMLWALTVSLPVHAAVVLSAMFAGMAFGLPLSWAYYWVCVPVIVLSGAIPISPQGAGVMEAFAVLLTRSQHVTVSQAFALTMSIRLVQILWNLAGGIFVFRGGYHAPTESEARELEPIPEAGPAVAV